MRLRIGIDPGRHGAIAAVDADTRKVVEIHDMPYKRDVFPPYRFRIDCRKLYDVLDPLTDMDRLAHATVERIRFLGSPKKGGGEKGGGLGQASFFENFGGLRSVLDLIGIRHAFRESRDWRNIAGRIGDTDDATFARAYELFPAAHLVPPKSRKASVDRAEALLMAYCGILTVN
jgi:hypothetical protein